MANITDQSHTLTGVFTRRRSPEPLGSNRPMSTAVAPNTYAGQSVKMTAGLAWTYHTSLSLRGSCQLQNYTRTKYTTRRCPTRGDIHVPNMTTAGRMTPSVLLQLATKPATAGSMQTQTDLKATSHFCALRLGSWWKRVEMACNVAFHIITLLQLLVRQSQSLLTRVPEHSTQTCHHFHSRQE